MPKTVLQITPDERRGYHLRAIVEQRQAEAGHRVEERWREAQQVSRQAADVLRQQFCANRVVLFGSAARKEMFTVWSDMDLAVWGVSPGRFFAAVAAVTRLSLAMDIDLVDADQCSPGVRAAIEREGMEL